MEHILVYMQMLSVAIECSLEELFKMVYNLENITSTAELRGATLP